MKSAPPTFDELAADPEIAALLDFEPVPRRTVVEGGWSPEKQRELIARLADHGSANRACTEMGMHRTGLTKLAHSKGAGSFQAAWEGAVELARRRRAEEAAAEAGQRGRKLPTVDHRRKHAAGDGPLPGQRMNEHGEWEDEESFLRRADEAKDSVRNKLVRARRWYLAEISGCPGKRAAFEILTELPIDWEKAQRGEPQEFEPLLKTNQRQPDMILTAESGWSMGEIGYGRDRREEMRQTLNEWRAEEGLPPIEWEGE